MQEVFRRFSQFSQRTDDLAAKLGVLIKNLPAEIGISARMLHGYRSGKYPISAKAWRKLEVAEKEAGLVPPEKGDVRGEAEDGTPRVREDEDGDTAAELRAVSARLGSIEAQLAELVELFERQGGGTPPGRTGAGRSSH